MQTAIAKSAVFVAAICSRERTGGRRGAASSCRSGHQANGNGDGTDHATQHIHHTQYTHIINDWHHRVHLHLHEIEDEIEIVRSNVNAEVALMLLAHGWRE